MKLKENEVEMKPETFNKVESFVREKYPKMFVNKPLVIKEFNDLFTVSDNKDASPLILGKNIVS